MAAATAVDEEEPLDGGLRWPSCSFTPLGGGGGGAASSGVLLFFLLLLLLLLPPPPPPAVPSDNSGKLMRENTLPLCFRSPPAVAVAGSGGGGGGGGRGRGRGTPSPSLSLCWRSSSSSAFFLEERRDGDCRWWSSRLFSAFSLPSVRLLVFSPPRSTAPPLLLVLLFLVFSPPLLVREVLGLSPPLAVLAVLDLSPPLAVLVEDRSALGPRPALLVLADVLSGRSWLGARAAAFPRSTASDRCTGKPEKKTREETHKRDATISQWAPFIALHESFSHSAPTTRHAETLEFLGEPTERMGKETRRGAVGGGWEKGLGMWGERAETRERERSRHVQVWILWGRRRRRGGRPCPSPCPSNVPCATHNRRMILCF